MFSPYLGDVRHNYVKLGLSVFLILPHFAYLLECIHTAQVCARIYTSIFDRCGNILWPPRTASVGAGFCIFLCLLIRPTSHPPLLFVRSINSMPSKRDGKWPQLCGVPCTSQGVATHVKHQTTRITL